MMGEQMDLWNAWPMTATKAPPTAEELRDAGMAQAVEHADDVSPSWSDVALMHVRQYARKHETLTGERVRLHAESFGFPAAPDARAWGAVMCRAAKEGVITKAGYTTAETPRGHRHPIVLWRRGRANGNDC